MSTDDLLTISGDFDQDLADNDDWLLHKVDEVIERARTEHNAYIALDNCKMLKSIIKTSGLGLAKLLYLIYHYWDEFGIEDNFEDVVYEYVGVHSHTVNRYVRVWGMHAENRVPEEYKQDILGKNIRDQIPIANALVQGYEITKEDWKNLAEAPDYNAVSQIILEDVKESPGRKSALHIFLDGMGTIWAKKGDEPKKFVGSLEIHSDEESVKQSIQRIIKNTGILEKI